MDTKIRIEKKDVFSGYYFFWFGFLIGMIVPNLLYKQKWQQSTVSALYLMGLFSGTEGKEYFMQVLKMRGCFFVLVSCSGITVFGVPVAVMGMIMMGTIISMILTVSILQFGFYGGVIGAALLLPQYVVYVPCLFYCFKKVYRNSSAIWKRKTFFSGGIAEYTIQMIFCAICYMVGIVLEAYCNPVIVETLIRNLKIF